MEVCGVLISTCTPYYTTSSQYMYNRYYNSAIVHVLWCTLYNYPTFWLYGSKEKSCFSNLPMIKFSVNLVRVLLHKYIIFAASPFTSFLRCCAPRRITHACGWPRPLRDRTRIMWHISCRSSRSLTKWRSLVRRTITHWNTHFTSQIWRWGTEMGVREGKEEVRTII